MMAIISIENAITTNESDGSCTVICSIGVEDVKTQCAMSFRRRIVKSREKRNSVHPWSAALEGAKRNAPHAPPPERANDGRVIFPDRTTQAVPEKLFQTPHQKKKKKKKKTQNTYR
jgi:hypothetical protein